MIGEAARRQSRAQYKRNVVRELLKDKRGEN